ncbi:MAG: histidine--tRNA ligase [Clostridiales bacterium]|nr:histidine--tRNA ligase [Clostridia bacterium]PWL97184.1 MAG: histidine--tRNA ligase [Clostridiales bacterium]
MINIPKGTKDVLPADSYKWQYVEGVARETARLFNLKEIRTPVFEHTEVFLRGVGDTTDIVTKEMYTFRDKGDRSITLKPEGTAGVARSFIENGLAGGVLPAKMYYIIPAFRYERPQAGRLREFHQFGVEIFGAEGADTDAEVIALADSLLKNLGLRVKLHINSIGCPACRAAYNKALREYFSPHLEALCYDCKTRFEKNPLRLLDCKEEGCRKINAAAPTILEYLCPECAAHFEALKTYLSLAGIAYEIDPRIVRGLDYYTRTVFEFVSDDIGAQGTVCGGGRYDGLIAELGGAPAPAVGFAAGIERLLLVMEATGVEIPRPEGPTAYLAGLDDACREKAFGLCVKLRAAGIAAETDHMKRSVKAQFKYADKLGAKYVAVIGGNELESGAMNVKRMATSESETVTFENAVEYFRGK